MRNKSKSPFSAAHEALKRLSQYRVILNGDTVDIQNRKSRNNIGEKVLIALQQNGSIREEETGFTASTIATYKRILRNLEWITADGGVWIWTGPTNAEWKTVTELNAKRRQ
jgi:hypothetical protein